MSTWTNYRPIAGSSPFAEGCHRSSSLEADETVEFNFYLRHRAPLPSPDCRLDSDRPTRSEFVHRHGADPNLADALTEFLVHCGLCPVDLDTALRRLRVRGSADQIRRALRVDLVQVEHPQGKYRSHRGPVFLPAKLLSIVQGVSGLDNRASSRPQVRRLQSLPLASPAKAFLPPQLAQIYQFPDADGTGQAVAVVELGGGYQSSDLESYFESLGLAMPTVEDISVNGGANRPGGSQDLEVYLDLEVIGSLVPKAKINVYFSPGDNASFIDAVRQAVHDPERRSSVVSISWASPEKRWQGCELQAMNETLQEAALLGVTVCVSSGDFGASSEPTPTDGYAHVEFPASSPYALACGGTRTLAEGTRLSSQSVWHDASGAGGGGVSSVFPIPDYQSRNNVTQHTVNPGHWLGRGVPDVAANADQETGYALGFQGRTEVVGGTSAAAPLWAALITRLNQRLGHSLGFVHPRIYSLARQSTGFTPVLVGNNANAPWVGGYYAAAGWNACCGWGSPRGLELQTALARIATEPLI